MLKRLFLTLTTTASLSVLYGLYALVVTPRVAPAMSAGMMRPRMAAAEIQAEPPPRNMEDAQRYLPNAEWAARAKIQIPLAHGVIYSNRWRAVDESQEVYEFEPFAMIWFDAPQDASNSPGDAADRENRRPLTLIAKKAGLIQFSEKFEPLSLQKKSAHVIGGKLEGDVHIAGPDGMSLKGRDLFFSEQGQQPKLYSDAPVEFAYQSHHGTADHGLQVELLPATGVRKPDQPFSFSGVRRVSLRGRVELDLVTDDQPIHITCDEGCDHNLESGLVSFKINVELSRATGPDQFDLIQTPYLDLILDEAPASRTAPQQARSDAPGVIPLARSNSTSDSDPANLQRPLDAAQMAPANRSTRGTTAIRSALRELRASGAQTRLVSQQHDLVAVMTNLIYDVRSRRAEMRDSEFVRIKQAKTGTELRCPELTLIQDEHGQIAQAIGRGSGWIRRRQADFEEFAAQWKSHFELSPAANSQQNVLELHGRAIVKQPLQKSGLSGELIRLWFDRPDNTAQNANSPSVRPRQLQAQKNVVVVSPQLSGKTNDLLVMFDESPPKTGEIVQSSRSRQKISPVAGSSKPADDVEPLQLTAERIRANVSLSPRENRNQSESGAPDFDTELAEVWTEGNVEVVQLRGDDAEPLHLNGQRLHLTNSGGNGHVLHVTGQPAVIRDRGFDIEGENVFLDRWQNRAWINGPGSLRLPVKNDLDGRKLTNAALLTIWWHERMDFDGQTATFLDDVKAVLSDSHLRCQEMEVVLTDRISFAGDGGSAAQAEVKQVICKDGVEIDRSQYVDKDLSEINRGHFAKLTIDQLTGNTEAIGPGFVSIWRPGRGKRAALAPRAVAQANRPLETDETSWEFTRVTFSGKTLGNLRNRQTTFHDRVRIVYGPVARPLDSIDPDNLPKDGGQMQCDALQILQRHDAATQRSYIELLAEGNANLEGRSFYARADSISFDESKELYTLRSSGNRQVTIWRQLTPGGDYDEASAKSMRFIPSRNYLSSDRTTGIRGSGSN